MMQFELGWNHLGSLNLVIRDFFEPRFDRCEPMRLAAMGTADFGEDLAETCKARRIDVESGGHFMPRRGADEKESRLTFGTRIDRAPKPSIKGEDAPKCPARVSPRRALP
jgi:hypothetical protein